MIKHCVYLLSCKFGAKVRFLTFFLWINNIKVKILRGL